MGKDPRFIVALDFPTREKVFQLVDQLNPKLCRLKVGITLFTRYGPDFVEALMQKDFSVFLDLKFHDIPYQVAGACRSAAELGVWMLTIHTLGGLEMCEAAANAISGYSHRPRLIGVTILTSANQDDLAAVGIEKNLEASVRDLATMAEDSGLDGVVCSPLEVADLRQQADKHFLMVTPGIRLASDFPDDQKRVMTPEEAFKAGSDYLVIGRSITQAENPLEILQALQ